MRSIRTWVWPVLLMLTLLQISPAAAQGTITVNSTADPGTGGCNATECTLREAIAQSNSTAFIEVIAFAIPGTGGEQLIQPVSPLPAITQPVEINGYTQPGALVNTLVQGSNAVLLIRIDGSLAGTAHGLRINNTSNAAVRGLIITNFRWNGLQFVGGGNHYVQGNYIGTDLDGAIDIGNLNHGIGLVGSSNNTIGGVSPAERNIISGNGWNGISVLNAGSQNNTIAGNYIGTDPSGLGPVGNGIDGVLIGANTGQVEYASNNIVGGVIPGSRNVISGNERHGIKILGGHHNAVAGNFIGTTVTGMDPLPNLHDGISVEDGTFNVIGGTIVETPTSISIVVSANLISGNQAAGVEIMAGSKESRGNLVVGNFVGTDVTGACVRNADGTCPMGNEDGVRLLTLVDGNFAVVENGIGGIVPEFRNLISGNRNIGVALLGPLTVSNRVSGNFIGTNAMGSGPEPNGGTGVLVGGPLSGGPGGSGNIVGGIEAGAGNLISGNGRDGVQINSGAIDTRVSRNLIGSAFDGVNPLANARHGVSIFDSPGNFIGGADPAALNMTSGNGGNGIFISGANSTANVIAGNYVGANVMGNGPLANAGDGIALAGANDNTISGNVVIANIRAGIRIADGSGNVLSDNFIGVTFDGTAFGNGEYGVAIENGFNNLVGNTDPSAPRSNVIAFNGESLAREGHGVVVFSGQGNSIRRNEIFDNAGRAIDLSGDVFDLNDGAIVNGDLVFDTDTGANGLTNYPVFLGTTVGALVRIVRWELRGAPNSSYWIDVFANSDPDMSGYGEGERLIRSVLITTDDRGRAGGTESFEPDEQLLAATATDEQGNTSEFSMVDTDGDGLADVWETDGIDVDEDGQADLVLVDADPLHADLFIEIDAMSSARPGLEAVFEAVAGAFASAPVLNPDGLSGIRLHFQLDETVIYREWTGDLDGDGVAALSEDADGDGILDPGEDRDEDGVLDLGDPDDQGGWPYFDRMRQGLVPGGGGFGTLEERQDPFALSAKRLAFRYGIYSVTVADVGGGNLTGMGEVCYGEGGNEFFLAAAPLAQMSFESRTGALMHEIGHMLGLDHGGGDDIDYKPNYRSVMNYLYLFPTRSVEFRPMWSLTYSTALYPRLLEGNLAEADGIGGDPARIVFIGPIFQASGIQLAPPALVPEGGPVDFNGDGDRVDVGVVRDLNFLFDVNEDGIIDIGDATPDERLVGHNDWPAIRLPFVGSPCFGDYRQAADTGPLVDPADLELFDAIGAGPGILEFSPYQVHELIEGAYAVDVRVVRQSGTTGTVTVDYAVDFGSATIGQDVAPVAGQLTFGPGEYVKIISVPLMAADVVEPIETIGLTLHNASGGATLGALATYEITVLDAEWRWFQGYLSDCGERPPGTYCLAFSDGFVWLTHGIILGWESRIEAGREIQTAITTTGRYEHIHYTEYAKVDWYQAMSYPGDCEDGRPPNTVCATFSDGFIWLINGPITGWDTRIVAGLTIETAIATTGRYEHAIGTQDVRMGF